MSKKLLWLCFAVAVPNLSQAFCGFYVAKADASLYNQASQVAMVRKDGKTVLSLMNDYQGELKDFALVIPVPQVLQKEQIHIGDAKLFKHLDDYSAPRLVEYHDDPCRIPKRRLSYFKHGRGTRGLRSETEAELGVKVEAEYTIGEYDIVILSAKESNGLETWLLENDYKIPNDANKALEPYIKQGMKFFVAKVNLKEQIKTGAKMLRPLQFAFESEKFMLPIRLGMINANGAQDLLLYVLTEKGRVESSNYQTLKLPSNLDIPLYVKNDFASFYKALFDHQANEHNLGAVFTEYFWNMSWCDPCASAPLSSEELRQLGVFWLDQPRPNRNPPSLNGTGLSVQITRLHVRYTNDSFPEDLMFQETGDTENFQARYVLRNSWNGSPEQCPAAKEYFKNLPIRHEQEAKNLADLTGWKIADIQQKMESDQPQYLESGNKKPAQNQWWKNLW